MGAISLRLPEPLERRLLEEARLCGQPRSELLREALEELLARRQRQRFEAELVAAARALACDAGARSESLAVSAEFLEAEQEALGRAEGGASSGASDAGAGGPSDATADAFADPGVWWR